MAAGGPDAPKVAPGCAVKIMTGSPVPEGCDAVVPFEDAEERGGAVRVPAPVKPRAHIRFRAEDIPAGTLVVPAGAVLRPPEISMLASFGRATVPVYRKPRVAVLSTGDELVELGEPIGPGQIVNSNSHALAAAIKEAGGVPIPLGIARDDRESLRTKISEGLSADLLVTSAGVSAGDRDFVRDVLAELGVTPVNKIKKSSITKLKLFKPDRPYEENLIANTLNKDAAQAESDALEEISKQLKAVDDDESAKNLVDKLFFNEKKYDLGEVGRYKINYRLGLNIPSDKTVITQEDIVSIINYLIDLEAGKKEIDAH